jgi:hypothetical protein
VAQPIVVPDLSAHQALEIGKHVDQDRLLAGILPATAVTRRYTMDVVYERCAGLDVHKETAVVCCITPGLKNEKRMEVHTFGTMTADLLVLSGWLTQQGITHVASVPSASLPTTPSPTIPESRHLGFVPTQ